MGNQSTKQVSFPTISNLNVNLYSGKWWEAARSNNIPFERDCERSIAEYTPHTDGNIQVVNTCFKQGSSTITASGWARQYDSNYPGRLKVKFNTMSSYTPESDYWIHWTNYNQYAIVGSPTNGFVWILSRNKFIPRNDILFLLNIVKTVGYDPRSLVTNPVIFKDDLPQTVIQPHVPLQ